MAAVIAGAANHLFTGEKSIAVNIGDTYYVVRHLDLGLILALDNFLFWGIYLLLYKLKIKIVRQLAVMHGVIMFTGMLTLYIAVPIAAATETIFTNREDTSLAIAACLFLLAQPLFVITLVVSIIRRLIKNKNRLVY